MDERHPRIGYIGIGLMGAPMATRLVGAGYHVTIWGRSEAKLAPVLAAGAHRADSAADVARAADIIFTCLSDTEAVETVVFGDDGIAAGAAAGKILVDMSSIRPEAAHEMATRLRDTTGMGWIDAPVSGGVVGSETGALTVMAGGWDEDFETVRPVVEHLAKRFTLMGPNGAGQATKLINQVFVGTVVAVLSEAAALAHRAGIDAARIPEALAGGRADSLPLQQFFPKMVSGDFFIESHVRTMMKDLDAVQAMARETGTAMPMTAMAAEIHRLMCQRGHGDEDGAAIARLYRDEPV
jgi:3-hydroxyisobutyrate dehydrogenase